MVEEFHRLEKECVGFDNYVNNDDKFYIKTFDGLRRLVTEI